MLGGKEIAVAYRPLVDRETDTLWYPYRKGLKRIQGKYFKRWLPKLPSDDTTWERWRAKNPGTEILEGVNIPFQRVVATLRSSESAV